MTCSVVERERILAVLPGAELEPVGLAAEPVELMLVVDDPRDEASYVPALGAAGYRVVVREDGWHDHRLLEGPGARLYVFGRVRAEPGDVEFVTENPPHNAPIELQEYDPVWPRWYAAEEAKIRAALGDAVVRVEHCGSTSVPGLAAKPLIDIVLVVPDSNDEDAYVPALVDAGYYLRLRERSWYEHRLLKGTVPNVNLHVFSPGCEEVDRMLTFRDRLRTHPQDRAEYEAAKRALASQTWQRVQDYADAKTRVVARIILRALS